jgi:hypothetical protein
MMVMTVICILAVDFPVFPRWQGKCENFGTSLVSMVKINYHLAYPKIDGRRRWVIRFLSGDSVHQITTKD